MSLFHRLIPLHLWPKTSVGISLVVLSALALFLQIGLVAAKWEFYQVDFRVYYAGAHLYAMGGDPYSVEAAVDWAKSEGLFPHRLPFVYSPLVLRFFAPLAMVSYQVAYGAWLVLQVLSLIAVFVLAVRVFCVPAHWMAPLLAFGLNGTCAAVLRTGQLTLVLMTLLLLFVLFLQKARPAIALAVGALAALPKVWLTPLLVLAAFPLAPWRVGLVALALVALIFAALSGQFIDPDQQLHYQQTIARLINSDRGPTSAYDQSIRNIIAYLSRDNWIAPEARQPVWLAYAVMISGLSAWAVLRLSRSGLSPERFYPAIFALGTLGLLLIVPRANIYQWTVALPAVAFVLFRVKPSVFRTVMIALVMIPTLYINRYVFDVSTDARLSSVSQIPWAFWNYGMCFVIWCLALKIMLWPDRTEVHDL